MLRANLNVLKACWCKPFYAGERVGGNRDGVGVGKGAHLDLDELPDCRRDTLGVVE
jgi:hypothetical protein